MEVKLQYIDKFKIYNEWKIRIIEEPSRNKLEKEVGLGRDWIWT